MAFTHFVSRWFSRMFPWAVVGIIAATAGLPVAAATADSNPSPIRADADWLTTVNYFRAMAGVGPVVEDASGSSGAEKHSCYMLQNGITHLETPGKPGYTAQGDASGRSSNVAVSSAYNTSARSHLDLWMTGPFHAIGVLRPNLRSAAFGKCDSTTTAPWRSAATLDVIHGLMPARPRTAPVLFPGDGARTNLTKFITESPDPLPYCGWSGTAGLPLIAMMPETVGGPVSASITGPAGPLETCALSALNTDGEARDLLASDNAVVAIARQPLTAGTYAVIVRVAARSISWHFTVDPSAGDAAAPAPLVAPSVGAGQMTVGDLAMQTITPYRIVDTRERMGADALTPSAYTRIQVTGLGGVPTDAKGVTANFTVTRPFADGYLTVWDCAANRPVVSTVNFAAGATVSNAAQVVLDGLGGLCVYSPVGLDLVVDLNGYYRPGLTQRFAPVSPVRLVDTRAGSASFGRLAGGQAAVLQVAGIAGVPAGAAAAVLNVTAIDSLQNGYVTVYPCDQPRPFTASLNPAPGQSRANLVVAELAADGTVCFYSSTKVDLAVDLAGYLSDSASLTFDASAPFRFTDTRVPTRIELNAGTGGAMVPAGSIVVLHVAGQRGMPADARAVSINITAVDATSSGYVTAFPCGPVPATSSLNVEAGSTVANAAEVALSSDGTLCLFSSTASHLIVDVNGWWS